jgi:hypothetical protein
MDGATGETMSQMPPDDREAARRKLIGRAAVIALLALVALYVYATFRPH